MFLSRKMIRRKWRINDYEQPPIFVSIALIRRILKHVTLNRKECSTRALANGKLRNTSSKACIFRANEWFRMSFPNNIINLNLCGNSSSVAATITLPPFFPRKLSVFGASNVLFLRSLFYFDKQLKALS